jgi:hypothetical protein
VLENAACGNALTVTGILIESLHPAWVVMICVTVYVPEGNDTVGFVEVELEGVPPGNVQL